MKTELAGKILRKHAEMVAARATWEIVLGALDCDVAYDVVRSRFSTSARGIACGSNLT